MKAKKISKLMITGSIVAGSIMAMTSCEKKAQAETAQEGNTIEASSNPTAMEQNCGGAKTDTASAAEHKCGEGKCGEGKCGGGNDSTATDK